MSKSQKYLINGKPVDISEFTLLAQDLELNLLDGKIVIRTIDGLKTALVARDGERVWISVDGQTYLVESCKQVKKGMTDLGSSSMTSLLPGVVVEVFVSVGDKVKIGQKLLVLEAMKTQMPLVAGFEGVVTNVHVSKGNQVMEGQLLVELEKGK